MLLNANTKKENSTYIHISLSTLREDNIHETGTLSWGVQMALFLHHCLQKQLYSNSEKYKTKPNFLLWITMEQKLYH